MTNDSDSISTRSEGNVTERSYKLEITTRMIIEGMNKEVYKFTAGSDAEKIAMVRTQAE